MRIAKEAGETIITFPFWYICSNAPNATGIIAKDVPTLYTASWASDIFDNYIILTYTDIKPVPI